MKNEWIFVSQATAIDSFVEMVKSIRVYQYITDNDTWNKN